MNRKTFFFGQENWRILGRGISSMDLEINESVNKMPQNAWKILEVDLKY